MVLLGLMAMAFGCARSIETHKMGWTVRQLTASKLPKFDIPIVVNDRVIAWIDYFQGPGHKSFARYLERSGRYVPQMQDILKRNGLPQDLVYLALIESGFSAKAYSHSRAAGHWQFIHGTGMRYGLAIGNGVDQRRDPENSTVAAARYLKDLHDEFGDWYLAMAAYNAGEGKIEKAIKITGTRNFWEMIDSDHYYLRAETKDYVPKFIAAAIIAKTPERFGFGDVVYDRPVEVEKARVGSQTDLEVIAKCAGVTVNDLEDLNPELTYGTTPPNIRNYSINLPKGTARTFEVAYAKVPESERVLMVRHTVRRGESLGRIAKRYGVSVREILAANDLSKSSSVKRGMTLVIPTGGAAKEKARYIAEEESGTPHGKLLRHRVRKGETVASIADNYDVSASMVRKWNKLHGNTVHAGRILKIYSSEGERATVAASKKKGGNAKSYIVRRGDSWSRIAQKHGVSINELKEWNPKIASRGLKTGGRLKIYARGDEPRVASSAPVESSLHAPADVAVNAPVVNMSASERLEPPVEAPKEQPELLSMKADAPQAVPKPTEKTISYKVKNGDTLWDIAKKYNVSIKSIADLNGFDPKAKLKPGKNINILTK